MIDTIYNLLRHWWPFVLIVLAWCRPQLTAYLKSFTTAASVVADVDTLKTRTDDHEHRLLTLETKQGSK